MTHLKEMHYIELLSGLVTWHQKQVEALNLVVEKKSADIDFGGDRVIKAGTEKHQGVRIGVLLALSLLGNLPLIQTHDEGEQHGK